MPQPNRVEIAKAKLAALESLLEKDILAGIECAVCGSKQVEKMIYADGNFICTDCGNHCDACSRFVLRKDLLQIEHYDRRNGVRVSYNYCQDCITNCAICGKVVPINSTQRMHLSFRKHDIREHVCRTCLGKLTGCGCCGAMDYMHKVDKCKRCGGTWCSRPSCQDNFKAHRCTPNVDMYLSQYNFKPPTIFLPAYRHDELYLGVELEFVVSKQTHYECCDELTKLAKKLGDFFYLKRDGSLGEWGVELVTQPATLEYHTKTPSWRLILNTILKHGGNVNDNCGLHVHISRNYLTSCRDNSRYWEGSRGQFDDETFRLNLWKLSVLFNKFWPDMLAMSRRKCGGEWIDRYCRKPPQATPDEYYDLINHYQESGKYTAVNTINNYTVEYRLWAATVREVDMIATIQLCAAISRYVKENGITAVLGTKNMKDILQMAVNKWGMKQLAPYLDSLNYKWR